MDEKHESLSLAGLKAEAKRLRSELRANGQDANHGECLNVAARRRGFRDWNAACARLPKATARLALGDRVSGRYLGHRFKGRLRGVGRLTDEAVRVEIEVDRPIDVVRFSAFSAFRRRVSGVVRADGKSLEKLSTGAAHLIVDQLSIDGRGARRGQ